MARASQNINVTEETTLDRLVAKGVSKVAVLVPPWIVAPIIFGMGAAYHAIFGGPATVAWCTVGMTLCVVVLTVLSWVVSHQRGALGRWCITATTALAGLWIVSATISGATAAGTLYAALVGGPTLALGWNIRSVIRMTGHEDAVNDRLSWLFDRGAEPAGVKGRLRTVEQGDHKIKARIAVEPGEQTSDDVAKKAARLESGMQIPPGSLITTPNLDRADHVDVTVTDPRTMRRPLPWPGPSRPGASIAEPLRLGIWQDAEVLEHVLPGHHLQVMGMTGSGKSEGVAWNFLSEIITRRDVCVLAADITKGSQFLGPLAHALSRFETTEAGVRDMQRMIQRDIRARTDYLASKGLTKWEQGCGIDYWVVWWEECPDIVEALGDKGGELWQKAMKAARSAGISYVLSLQRSDFTQMPTLARGQLAHLCMGVATSKDADFGLSEAQQEAGAQPELWSNKQPGMLYLDAPGIPPERVAMPGRLHAIELGDLKRETAAYTARPVVTLANPDDPDDDVEVGATEEHLSTEDPDPSIQVGPDDPIEDADDDPDITFERPAARMTTEDARAALRAQIDAFARERREHFTTRDLAPVWERVGRSRSWLIRELNALAEADVIDRDDQGNRWMILAPVGAG